MKQKTPLRRKPKAATLRAQRQQREAVRARSEGRCEAEVFADMQGTFAMCRARALGLPEPKPLWARCIAPGAVAAHIYPRTRCGPARDLPTVVLYTCQRHNVDHLHDGRSGVRAPLTFTQAAFDAIVAASKETVLLGPRPERGEGVFHDGSAYRPEFFRADANRENHSRHFDRESESVDDG